ncbi:MFS transporter [Marseilla massiliensis]|jgi:DHA1 family arabinose polymer transporter-like MFS transporter|uniref:MFS transporter n=1 Tax=Marseilla massiliensis TaxID=1841864 RepID=A0A939B6I3_9BACT|nr:MFS transporter [Marseilla massiliensis]MBM6674319.1 MFS transporter [Marseilla massiliensis]
MKKSLVALAFGTLALGIAEFVMMGILPDVARSLGVSIPDAGHLISAYALGVCCGAPLLVIVHKYPLKNILLCLAGIILLGSTLAALSVNYWMLLVSRFISGLPHGAYFGVASIVAVQLADERHKTGAVSIMIAGMTVANLFGVPLATSLSSQVSWRFPFVLVIFVSIIVLYYIWKWVPGVGALPDNGFRHQFAFLKKRAPWLILSSTMFANGGIFCWYSYISPLLTTEGGFAADVLPALMIAAGFGMVAGNLVSGRLCDRHRPSVVVASTISIGIVSLLLIFLLADYGWVSAALMIICTGCLFAVSSPQQYLILKYAPGGELLGGASIQMAFNMGNALGAFCGGLPIAAGLPPRYAALVGVPFLLCGLIACVIFSRKYEPKA